MPVGEQPGDVEDQRGIPFAVKHFRFETRGKRRIHQTPEPAHMVTCRPWLDAELAEVSPEVIVLLGATAAKALIGPSFRVTRERGTLGERDTVVGTRKVLATVHPSSILRAPEDQRDASFVDDLSVLAAHLAG